MLGVFGSAFNPPTLGHADLIQQALETGHFQKILLVPSYRHAFGKSMADYSLRCQLVSAFIADMKLEECQLYAVEDKIANDRPIYTYDLMHYIETQFKQPIGFILGEDNWLNFNQFYKADDIKQRWPIFVGKERKNIRSTLVRARLEQHQDVSHLITPGVQKLIQQWGLYHDNNR
jgi:nicotinate-nucleotide adenylyltransferase